MHINAEILWIERLCLHERLSVAISVNVHDDSLVVLYSDCLGIFKHQTFGSKRTLLHKWVSKRHWDSPIEETWLWGPKQKVFAAVQTCHKIQSFGRIFKTVDRWELFFLIIPSQNLFCSVISHIKIPKSITSNIPNVLPAIDNMLTQKHNLIRRKVVISIEVIVLLILSSLSGLYLYLIHCTWVLNIVEVRNICLASCQISQMFNICQQIILFHNSSLTSLTSKWVQLNKFYWFSYIGTDKQVFKAMERELKADGHWEEKQDENHFGWNFN